jgi:hypothetical protein
VVEILRFLAVFGEIAAPDAHELAYSLKESILQLLSVKDSARA